MDAKERALEKMKKGALDWHKKELAEEWEISSDASEQDAITQELELVRELKKIIVESNLERKSVFLSALAIPEQMLERGKTSQNLPMVMRNLLRKEEIRGKVLEATKKYKVAGKSYYYMWGLDDERDAGLY